MLAGHYAAGFAAKAAARPGPLWVLFVAVQFLDIVWGLLVLTGVEELRIREGLLDASDYDLHYMPWSHGLLSALVWSGLAFLVVRHVAPAAWRSARAGLVVAGAVLSHWPLDLIAHRADLPLYGDEHKVGLELWASVPATIAVEGLLLAGPGWEERLKLVLNSLSLSERACLFAVRLADEQGLPLPAETLLDRARTDWFPEFLSHGQMKPHFQPIIELSTGRAYGREALMRGMLGTV